MQNAANIFISIHHLPPTLASHPHRVSEIESNSGPQRADQNSLAPPVCEAGTMVIHKAWRVYGWVARTTDANCVTARPYKRPRKVVVMFITEI